MYQPRSRAKFLNSKLSVLFSLVIATELLVVCTAHAQFVGVSLDAPNQTVPPGGLLQMQVFVTEPNPILKGSQRSTFSSKAAIASPLGSVRDVAMFSPNGDADGVAVLGTGGTVALFFNSPLTSFGTSIDSPVFTIQVPVKTTATKGQTVPLQLDTASSVWLDPNSQPYPLEVKSGIMTVGGTLSVSDVSPASGIIPAGTVITITGTGFQSSIRVDVNNATVGTTKVVNSSQMQVTLAQDFAILGQRVRLTNKNTNEKIEYYPYPRALPTGKSTHALVNLSYAIFPNTTWTSAYVTATLNGTVFTGLALQNLNSTAASVTLDLFSSSGTPLGTKKVSVGAQRRITRDLSEVFPGLVADGTYVHVTSNQLIQVLGLLGDDALGTVQPIEPTSTP